MPIVISSGQAPVFAVSLRICFIIYANSSGGPYRRCSTFISSIPWLLLYFSFFIVFSTSSVVY